MHRLFLLLLAFSAETWAQAAPATAAPTSDLGGSLVQLVLGLALVLALLLGSLWLLKRLVAPRGETAGLLRVVAGAAVGTRERVVIVEVGSTWLVLGVAPGQVAALAEVPRQSLPPQATSASATVGDFPDWLKKLLQKR